MELLFICIDLFLTLFRPIYFLRSNWISRSLISQIYEFYFLEFLVSVLEMSIIILHIIATFDYYILITKLNDKSKFFQKLEPKLVTFVVFVFSSLCYLYLIFTKEIRLINLVEINEKNESLNLRIIYQMNTTHFWDTNLKKILEIVVFFVRDGINLTILITLNILIYVRVLGVIKTKERIFNNMQNRTSKMSSCNYSSNGDIQIQSCYSDQSLPKLERKVTIMVIAGCINHLIGRLPILISFLLKNYIVWDRFLIIFDSIAVTTVYISYMMNFFIFYLTNNRFKVLCKKLINKFRV